MGRIKLSDVGAIVDALALGLFSRDSMKACFASGCEQNQSFYRPAGPTVSTYSSSSDDDCDCNCDCDCERTCVADDCACDTSRW